MVRKCLLIYAKHKPVRFMSNINKKNWELYIFAHFWEKGGVAGRFSPASWCFPPDRHTDPHPDGMHWAAAAPGSRWCPAGWAAIHATGACPAASGSDRAAPTQSARTPRRWPRGTRQGCHRAAGPPYTAGPHGPPPWAHWMETRSPQGHLQHTVGHMRRNEIWMLSWLQKEPTWSRNEDVRVTWKKMMRESSPTLLAAMHL